MIFHFKSKINLFSLVSVITILMGGPSAFAESPEALEIKSNHKALSPLGVFDPSLTRDSSGNLWMSYSSVTPDPEFGVKARGVSTRIAKSSDQGKSWSDRGVISASYIQPLPPPHNRLHARWEFEVARILYDPFAPKEMRWKSLSHRYLSVYDGKSEDAARLFEHGWMELKTAASPTGPWSSPRKLFVGFGYKKDNDNNIGVPEFYLNKMNADMKSCAAFTEPGLLARENGVYVALTCHTGRDSKVILLGCDHALQKCSYKGILLTSDMARELGDGLSGFSGTDLVEHGSQAYVVATPTRQPGDIYQGCAFYKINDLEQARVDPKPAEYIQANPDSFSGACGYIENVGGIYLSQLNTASLPIFRISKTGKMLGVAP